LIYLKIEQNLGVGSRETAKGVEFGKVAWPSNARAVTVIAVEHKNDEPQLDWWDGRNGCFSRAICSIQMEEEINHAEILPAAGTDETGKRIKYCRRCESACPGGRPSKDKSGS